MEGFEDLVVTLILYGCEAWAIEETVQKRVNVWEMKCLRTKHGVRRVNRVSNDGVREKLRKKEEYS